MAEFNRYVCKECGHTIETDPHGHYGLMAGEFFDFYCEKCKEIVSISSREIAAMGYFIKCPQCGNEKLYTWNAKDGHCPKCNGELEMVEGVFILAD